MNDQIGQIVDCEKQENSKEGWNATGIRIKFWLAFERFSLQSWSKNVGKLDRYPHLHNNNKHVFPPPPPRLYNVVCLIAGEAGRGLNIKL